MMPCGGGACSKQAKSWTEAAAGWGQEGRAVLVSWAQTFYLGWQKSFGVDSVVNDTAL